MKTIYHSEEGKQEILKLYDKQLERLHVTYRDLYVETSFGRTHLIETGAFDGEPLLVFHGGNATTAYNLLACGFFWIKGIGEVYLLKSFENGKIYNTVSLCMKSTCGRHNYTEEVFI